MRTFTKVMKALSDPNRIRILKLLQEKELCVCELKELFPLSQPTISKHLRVLEEVELVTFRKQGSWVIYRLTESENTDHAKALLAYLRKSEIQDEGLQNMLLSLPQVDRERIKAA